MFTNLAKQREIFIFMQLLTNWNNDEDIGSHHDEAKTLNNEPPNTKKLKERSSVDAEVIKDIEAQIASLA